MNNAVDSFAWVEYFVDGPNAAFFSPAIEDPECLVAPSLSLHEVFRSTLQHQDEGRALRAVAQMKQASVCGLDDNLALAAARISLQMNLPMVESIMSGTLVCGHRMNGSGESKMFTTNREVLTNIVVHKR